MPQGKQASSRVAHITRCPSAMKRMNEVFCARRVCRCCLGCTYLTGALLLLLCAADSQITLCERCSSWGLMSGQQRCGPHTKSSSRKQRVSSVVAGAMMVVGKLPMCKE
jgi:hypothetical protein